METTKPADHVETIITHKNYRHRNEYIRDYQRNRYKNDEAFRLMKIKKVKESTQRRKDRLLYLENKYKEIS
jgi:hypothetical protein